MRRFSSISVVGEATQLADRDDDVVHHRRITGERLERDASTSGASSGPRSTSHPTIQQNTVGGMGVATVAHELAAAVACRRRSSRSSTSADGPGAQGLDATWREPRHDCPSQLLVVVALGAEQRAPARVTVDRSGEARRIISNTPGWKSGSTMTALQPA